MTTAIAHVAINVSDMEISRRFYQDALGFEHIFPIAHPETGKPWIEYLSLGGGQFVELFYTNAEPGRPNPVGFNHLCFRVDDINAAVKRVTDAGFEVDAPPKLGADHNWQAWTTDPDGIRIELMQFTPESPQAKYL